MKHYLLQIESVKQNLREDFLYLTEVLLKKTIPHTNKQLQDTLTKYFLENYVSDLLKDKMRKNNNRAVFQEISKTISSGRPKYLKLLNAFEDKLRFFQLDSQYNNMLLILILDVGRHPRNGEEWRTHTRKRMLSLLLYVHWNEQDKRDEFQSFFEMWKVAYPENPLPQRQFKNAKIHTFDSKNMYSSQSLEDDSLYNQQNNHENSNHQSEAQPHKKTKKIKVNENLNQQQQQPADIVNGIETKSNRKLSGFNIGNHFKLDQQQQQQGLNDLIIQQQTNTSSLLNQNIIKYNNVTQQNGFIFNPQNIDFLNNTSNVKNGNEQNQGNSFGTKNMKHQIGGDHQQQYNQPAIQNNQSLVSQQPNSYFYNTTGLPLSTHHDSNLSIGPNQLSNKKDLIFLDQNNFAHNYFINNVKQEQKQESINQTDNLNTQQKQPQQQQQQQWQHYQNQQCLIESQQNSQSQAHVINGHSGQENSFENSLNNGNNSMFFTNNQSIGGQNALMSLNNGQHYQNFFQIGGGTNASQYYQQSQNNPNFVNYNNNNNNNSIPNQNNNMNNMTSSQSYSQLNNQNNNNNQFSTKANESQNFSLNLNNERQLEKLMMDSSYNNEIFTVNNAIPYYPNLSHMNQITSSIKNSESNDQTNLLQKQIIDLNQINQMSNNHHNQGNVNVNATPIKLEVSMLQSQQQQQNKSNFYNTNQFLSSKFFPQKNDHIQSLPKSYFNMENSGNNFNNFQNNKSYINGSTLGNNIFSLGGGLAFQSDIQLFFSQYYSEQKEEFSWESTEPLSIYANNQAPILNELNSLFLSKLNALPLIQKVKERNVKLAIQQAVSKEKEDECLSEIVSSYEVDQNPISQ